MSESRARSWSGWIARPGTATSTPRPSSVSRSRRQWAPGATSPRPADELPRAGRGAHAHGPRGRGAGRHVRFLCLAHPITIPPQTSSPSAACGAVDAVTPAAACRTWRADSGLRNRHGPVTDFDPAASRHRPGHRHADWADAWSAIVETARRQERRLDPYRDLFRSATSSAARHQLVADARRIISALGPEDPAAWRLARLAARVET